MKISELLKKIGIDLDSEIDDDTEKDITMNKDGNKKDALKLFNFYTKEEKERDVKEVNVHCTFLKDNLLGFINKQDNMYKNDKILEYGIYKKYQIAENTLFWIHVSLSRLFTDDHSFSLLFIQESFHIITRSVFYLDVNLSNILSNQSNTYQLNTAKEPDGQNKGCPPFYYMTGAITDQCIAGS